MITSARQNSLSAQNAVEGDPAVSVKLLQTMPWDPAMPQKCKKNGCESVSRKLR